MKNFQQAQTQNEKFSEMLSITLSGTSFDKERSKKTEVKMKNNSTKNSFHYSWTKAFADLFWLGILLSSLIHIMKAMTE